MTMKTKKTNPKVDLKQIDELLTAAERCLAELRALGRRNQARRAVVQARYADLGAQLRQAYSTPTD